MPARVLTGVSGQPWGGFMKPVNSSADIVLQRQYRAQWDRRRGSLQSRLRATVAVRAILSGLSALMLMAPRALAEDFHYIGKNILQPWQNASSWAEKKVPGRDDRAIMSSTAASVDAGGREIGQVFIPDTAPLTSFSQVATSQAVTIFGIDGVGVQSDSAKTILFFREVLLGGDIRITATSEAGGGFRFPATNNRSNNGFYTDGHTLTLDPVNQSNLMELTGAYGVYGTGNLITSGEGTVVADGATDNSTYRTSLLQYTGYTWVQSGTFSLIGTASLRNSSGVRVDGTLDLSRTADGRYDLIEGKGGSSVRALTGQGTIVLGNRNLTLLESGTDYSGTISGAGKLILKEGTSLFSGENTYQGGTDVMGSTLAIAGSKAAGSGTISLTDNATLRFVADEIDLSNALTLDGQTTFDTDFTATLSGLMAGSGGLVKTGTGTLILGTAARYGGDSFIEDGVLAAGGNDVFSPHGVFHTSGSGLLDLAGHDQTIAGLSNAGMVRFGGDTSPGTTLTITGDYAGSDGMLVFHSALEGDDSVSDRLIVMGDTSGSTRVKVLNAGGTGDVTAEGIRLIDVRGHSEGSFSLVSDYRIDDQDVVVIGAYVYGLYKNGVKDNSDGNWYLRSRFVEKPTTETDPELPGEPDPDLPALPDPDLPAGSDSELPHEPHYQAGVPVYEAYAQSLLAASGLPTLAQRSGNRLRAGTQAAQDNGAATYGIWGRVEGAHSRISPRSSRTVGRSDTDIRTMQAGIDGQFLENDSGSLTGGITVQYSNVSTDVSSRYGDGEINTDGYGAGGSLTYYGGDGFYLDGQAQAIWYRSDLSSALVRKGLTERNDAFGFGFSAEAGQQLRMSENWTVTPQGQLVYSSVAFDRFTDVFGSVAASERASSLLARLGVSADYAMDWRDAAGKERQSRSYVIANLYQELLDGSRISSAGVDFATKSQPSWGGIGAGGSYSWADDKYRVYGELLVKTSFGDFGRSYSAGGTAGLRVAF